MLQIFSKIFQNSWCRDREEEQIITDLPAKPKRIRSCINNSFKAPTFFESKNESELKIGLVGNHLRINNKNWVRKRLQTNLIPHSKNIETTLLEVPFEESKEERDLQSSQKFCEDLINHSGVNIKSSKQQSRK